MDMREDVQAVFTALLEHCTAPPSLPGPWSFLPTDPAAFRLPGDLAPVIDAMRSIFDEGLLVEAGILSPRENAGSPTVNLPGGEIVIVMRQGRAFAPYGVVASKGCLGVREIPAVALINDGHLQTFLEDTERHCVVVFTMEDFLLLRSLGIAAVPATELQPLTETRIRELSRVFDIDRTATNRHQAWYAMHGHAGQDCDKDPEEEDGQRRRRDDKARITLTILGWTLRSVSHEMADAARGFVEHLRQLEQNVRLETAGVSFWRPSQDVVKRVRFCLAAGEGEWVRETLLDSLVEAPTLMECRATGYGDASGARSAGAAPPQAATGNSGFC